MAWFSSIVNGIGSAANWLLSNSGLVSNVLETVGTVAKGNFLGTVTNEGYVIVENTANAEEDCDCSGDLTKSFKNATKKLEQKAQEGEKLKVPQGGSQSNATLSGLWTNPGLTLDGTATPEMYRDIGKFLAENDMPTELKTSTGGTTDVSQEICNAIFANVPVVPKTSDVEGVAIQMPSFNLGDGECKITGTHAYYSIPLGKRNNGLACDDQAWHGAVQVTKTSTEAFDIAHAKKRKNLFFVAQEDEIAETGPRWVVTCQVDWRTIPLAEKAQEKLKEKFEKDYRDYKLLYSGVAGQNQTIKIGAPNEVTPARVRAILSQVVTDVAKSVTQDSSQIFNRDQLLSENTLSSQVRSVLNLVVSETERKLAGDVHEMRNEANFKLQTPEVTVTNSTLVT
ncbi:hypothetical protein N7478_010898 [Penicillium angulare]|uniref:uncharacterized protein n=1 Tax=Penicillium angulare TaxID=116970 RepID=UPI002540F498|nr:uncharacterized protein N7478_010898 [Penicillium angulare]KAJ5263293.1 hypothetical protein N7478_010898 [Penicillium angulare]